MCMSQLTLNLSDKIAAELAEASRQANRTPDELALNCFSADLAVRRFNLARGDRQFSWRSCPGNGRRGIQTSLMRVVVFDTNVLFAAFVARGGLCARIVEEALAGHQVFLSQFILPPNFADSRTKSRCGKTAC